MDYGFDSLRRGPTGAEAVVHLADKRDFGPESVRVERAAVEAMAESRGDSENLALSPSTAAYRRFHGP